jgi:hypothetical protein
MHPGVDKFEYEYDPPSFDTRTVFITFTPGFEENIPRYKVDGGKRHTPASIF